MEIEFRKGVLFVRLTNSIDNNLKEVNSIIENIGIKYLVLNTDEIKYFNINDISIIETYNTKILKENKKMIICDKHNNRDKLFYNIPNIKCEIDAFSLI